MLNQFGLFAFNGAAQAIGGLEVVSCLALPSCLQVGFIGCVDHLRPLRLLFTQGAKSEQASQVRLGKQKRQVGNPSDRTRKNYWLN